LPRPPAPTPDPPFPRGGGGGLAKANAARRTCPACRRDAGYVIPISLGMCVPCAYPDPSAPEGTT
ncbi:hypothetical protein ACFU9Y_39355, partial [Streptomyces sp. NPDC057621]